MSARPSSSKAQAPDPADDDVSDNSEAYDSEDNKFDDWVEDDNDKQPCMSLFGEGIVFASVEEALGDAKKKYGVDLWAVCNRLELDFYDCMRLVNYLRKQRPTPAEFSKITGREPFFSDDAYLIPVIEDDPLLLGPPGDAWSDEEVLARPAAPASTPAQASDLAGELRHAQRTIRSLQEQLAQARQELVDYREMVNKTLGVNDVKQWVEMKAGSSVIAEPGKSGEDPEYFDAFEDVEDDQNLQI